MNLHITFTFKGHSCCLRPFSVQFPQVFPRRSRRVVSSSILKWCELLLSNSLEKPDFVGLFKNIEIKKLKLDTIVFLHSDSLS